MLGIWKNEEEIVREAENNQQCRQKPTRVSVWKLSAINVLKGKEQVICENRSLDLAIWKW